MGELGENTSYSWNGVCFVVGCLVAYLPRPLEIPGRSMLNKYFKNLEQKKTKINFMIIQNAFKLHVMQGNKLEMSAHYKKKKEYNMYTLHYSFFTLNILAKFFRRDLEKDS